MEFEGSVAVAQESGNLSLFLFRLSVTHLLQIPPNGCFHFHSENENIGFLRINATSQNPCGNVPYK